MGSDCTRPGNRLFNPSAAVLLPSLVKVAFRQLQDSCGPGRGLLEASAPLSFTDPAVPLFQSGCASLPPAGLELGE